MRIQFTEEQLERLKVLRDHPTALTPSQKSFVYRATSHRWDRLKTYSKEQAEWMETMQTPWEHITGIDFSLLWR